MYYIYNNNNTRYFRDLSGLIDTTPNCKEFSLSISNIDCMIDCFLNWTGVRMNVSNRYGNVVHNTGIKDNNNQIDT